MQIELGEKTELVQQLQSEVDEQKEYQEMVAKLAETVNRKKPLGMTGMRIKKPLGERNVCETNEPEKQVVPEGPYLSQEWYN